MSHTTTVRVRFYELDPYGHVNHSVYVQYFEAARIEWLAEVGLPLHVLQSEGVQMVVTELNTRYLGSAGPEETLTIETELADLRRASMSFRQRILRDGQVLVEQTVTAATVTPEGRPTRVPEDLVEALSGS